MAFVVVALVIGIPLLRDNEEPTTTPAAPPTTQDPGQVITLDELQAMLSDSRGEPPASFQVETPEGPVTVVVPSTTRPPASTTTSSTTTTSTTQPRPPVVHVPPDIVQDDIIDQLLGQSVPSTIPEVVGDGT